MNNIILTSAKALYVTLTTMVILFLSSCSGQQLKSWPERENYFMQLIDEGDIDTANELVALIKKEVACKNVYINYIGPIVGASVGPGAVAVQFFGNEVTIS